jgi:adenylate cyclase
MAEIGEPDKPDSAAPSAIAGVVRSVFISYASEDVAVADKVCSALEAAGFPCWIAPRDVRAGEPYAAAIVEAINACRLMVLVLTKSAIHSRHVFREIERASSKDHQVLSIRMDATELPPELEYFLSADQWLDASGGGPVERVFPALVESVRGRDAGKTARSEVQPRGSPGTLRASGSGADTHAPHTAEHGHDLPFKIPFLEQLKRRNVARIAILYIAVCYLILEPFSMFLHVLALPEWTGRTMVLLMVLGFPAVVILAWVFEMTPEGLKPTAEVESRQSIRKLTGRQLDVAIIIVLVLALGYFVADKFWLSKRSTTAGETALVAAATSAAAPTAPTLSEKSIAVLPFTDMSEKKDQEYFADGMAEEILDLLVKIPGLTVIGRTSSFQFKSRNEDLRSVGEKLGAAYVVEGSIRKAGARIRVTSQLIDTKTGAHLWSESYDRDFGDVLILQDEIATSIARALQLTVGARDARPLRNQRAVEAYTVYLRAKVALDKFNTSSLAEAQSGFEQALALDPTLLPAAEGLALTYLQRGIDENDISGREAWEHAKVAAKNVLQIDENSATAHSVLGFVAGAHDFDWTTAEAEFHRALTLNPNDPNTLEFVLVLAQSRGHHDEALRLINASLTLDPLNANTQQGLGIALYTNHDHTGAESAFLKSLTLNRDMDSSHYFIGLIQLLGGHRDGALKEFLADAENSNRDCGIALVNHALGKKAESDAALARLADEAGTIWPYGVALVHAYRGERDKAFEWLEKAYAARDLDLLTFVLKDPLLTPLHDDPRYKELLRKMNLLE